MACLSGSPMWEKANNAMSCSSESTIRSAMPEWVLNRQSNITCPSMEDLDMNGDYSASYTCLLRSMGYLREAGGVRNGRIKRDIAQLNPLVVLKYSGGNLTEDDPSGYKQCVDSLSYYKDSIPEIVKSCPSGDSKSDYRMELKRFYSRLIAVTCLNNLSYACQDVFREQVAAQALGTGYGTEYGSEYGTGYGSGYGSAYGSGYGTEYGTGYGSGTEY